MKKLVVVITLVLTLSGMASALTYIDTPVGRRPIEGGEWFVTGGAVRDYEWAGLDREYEHTRSVLSIEYYLTPQLAVRGQANWSASEGETLFQPTSSISLDSDLSDDLKLQLAYDWSESRGHQRQSLSAVLRYEHLNH